MTVTLATTLAQVIPVLALALVIEIRAFVRDFIQDLNDELDSHPPGGSKRKGNKAATDRYQRAKYRRRAHKTLRLIVLVQIWMLAFLSMLELYCLSIAAKPITSDLTFAFLVIAIGISFVTFAPLLSGFLVSSVREVLFSRQILILAYSIPYFFYGLYGLSLMPGWLGRR